MVDIGELSVPYRQVQYGLFSIHLCAGQGVEGFDDKAGCFFVGGSNEVKRLCLLCERIHFVAEEFFRGDVFGIVTVLVCAGERLEVLCIFSSEGAVLDGAISGACH